MDGVWQTSQKKKKSTLKRVHGKHLTKILHIKFRVGYCSIPALLVQALGPPRTPFY